MQDVGFIRNLKPKITNGIVQIKFYSNKLNLNRKLKCAEISFREKTGVENQNTRK